MYCYIQYGWWNPQWCVVFNHQHKSSATDPAQTSRLLRGLLLLLHLAAAWPKAVIIPLRRVYIVWYSQLVGGLKHVLCFHILGIVIPTDFHIFQRGWNHQPTNVMNLKLGVTMTLGKSHRFQPFELKELKGGPKQLWFEAKPIFSMVLRHP